MMRSLSMLVLALMLGACDAVQTREPVGGPLPADSEVDLTGLWRVEEGDVVHIMQLEGGELRLAGVEWDQEQARFVMHEFDGLLTHDEGAYYLNLGLGGEAREEARYSFFRLLVSDGHMVMLGPRVGHFEAAVEAGELAGRVERREHSRLVHVEADRDALTRFVRPGRVGEQFEVDQSMMLERLTAVREREAGR